MPNDTSTMAMGGISRDERDTILVVYTTPKHYHYPKRYEYKVHKEYVQFVARHRQMGLNDTQIHALLLKVKDSIKAAVMTKNKKQRQEWRNMRYNGQGISWDTE